MANVKHLQILNQGVQTWNQWRKRNPTITPDLSSLNLVKADFYGANLKGVNLSASDLREANLETAELDNADFTGADLRNASFLSENLAKANLNSVDLSRMDLSKSNFSNANLYNANFSEAILCDSDLSVANLERANFRKANLSSVELSEANLCYANLEEAFIEEANLNHAILSSANLIGADLTDTSLFQANLSHANLSHTFLITTGLLGADLSTATLTGACIEDWNINQSTRLDDIICDYIYLRTKNYPESEWEFCDRRPSDANKAFAPGEFVALVQKSLETIDLIFIDGIDWKAFFSSFQELQKQYAEDDLVIQAIERKGQAFIIRLESTAKADKAAIETRAKELYKIDLQQLEIQYRAQLQAKDKEIDSFRRESTNMLEIARLLANRPVRLEEPKVTLHTNQIKILQAVQQGLCTAEEIAQDSNLSVDQVNYYMEEMENDYLQCTKYLVHTVWNLTKKGKIAATDPDSLLPSERSAKYDLRGSKFGGGFAAERGTQTGGTFNDYSVHIGQNIDDINRLIASLHETIQHFPTEQQKEAEGELIDLEEDIKTPAKHDPERFGRRLKRIAAAGTAALTISGGTATFSGNLDKFAGNVVELTEKLQVPIEYVQSHLPK